MPQSPQESIPQAVAAMIEHTPEQYDYHLLTGHYRSDGSYKTSQQLRMEYIQLTDELIYKMVNGVEVTDRTTGEKQVKKPDVVIWLDKSARPVSWLAKDLWNTMAPDLESDEIPTMPQFKFLNIDKEQWTNAIDTEGSGLVDIHKIDESIIRSLRSIFVSGRHKEEGLTEAIDVAPTALDNKTVLIIDEVRASGQTLKIAQDMLERAFPSTRFAGTYWMDSIAIKGGAIGNLDLPVWYKKENVYGRGVGDRDPHVSASSENTTQRLGAWFLSVRFSNPDTQALQLRDELHQLATHPDVPVLPSLSRPDRKERLAALNHTTFDEARDWMMAVKSQQKP